MKKFLAIAMGLLAIGLLPMEAQAKKKLVCTKSQQTYQGGCGTDSNGNSNKSDAARSKKSGSKPSAPSNPPSPPEAL